MDNVVMDANFSYPWLLYGLITILNLALRFEAKSLIVIIYKDPNVLSIKMVLFYGDG